MDLKFLSPLQRDMAQEIIDKCALSRVFFVKEILKVDNIENWQLEELEALDTGTTKVSIRSGHGVGKTAFCSWLALHFLLFRDDVKIIVTSPSLKQMNDGLMPEAQKWIARLPIWMSRSLESTSDRITRKPNTRNNFISFRTARKENPEALAGVHAAHVLIIVDEASGVDEVIYETGQGALSTKGSIAVLIGNPTKPSGFFYKTQTSLSDLWRSRKVSCLDSSRVDTSYIESQKRTYGENSAEYAVRVLGEFPESGADSIIPRAFVMSAINRDIVPLADPLYWGIDPGRGGDPTGFVARSPNAIIDLKELRYEDLMSVVGYFKTKWDGLPASQRPEKIFVDVIGLGGGVADRLSELDLPVVKVNVAEVASLNERYMRLRTELWFNARSWFEQKNITVDLNLPLLHKLVDELVSIEYKMYSSGKVEAESKDSMKRRGMPSPNLADALCLTFAEGGAIAYGAYAGGSWKKVNTTAYRAPGFAK